jgi:hypothetical protein
MIFLPFDIWPTCSSHERILPAIAPYCKHLEPSILGHLLPSISRPHALDHRAPPCWIIQHPHPLEPSSKGRRPDPRSPSQPASPSPRPPRQIVHQHKLAPVSYPNKCSKKSPSLRSGLIARLRRTLKKTQGAALHPPLAAGHAFNRHAWLRTVSLARPQCFNAASPLLYTIALNYFSSIYGEMSVLYI